MVEPSRAIPLRSLIAVLCVLAALALRALLDPFLGDAHPFVLFLGAVIAAAWFGGTGPALVATVLGYLAANYFFITPRFSLEMNRVSDIVGLAAYLLSSGTIALLGGAMRQARQRAEASAREATDRQAELEREMTERQRAEAARREQEEWLQITLGSIGDAVIATDTEGRVIFMNPVAERLTGWTQAEAAGAPLAGVFRIVNEYTRQPAESPVTRVLRDGAVVGLANHTLLIARDSTERPIDDSAAPIRRDLGTLLGVVLVFRDITERKQAEAARAELAAIVESSGAAIIGKSLDGQITSWNDGAERLYGFSAGEVIGNSMEMLLPPGEENVYPAIIERLKAGASTQSYEATRRRKDGTLIEVSAMASPIKNPAGQIVGVSVVARDITARKRAEEALRFLADASTLLSNLVEYEGTLRSVTRLAVPFLADLCVVDLLTRDGRMERVAVAHAEPGKEQLFRQATERYPVTLVDQAAPSRAIRSGQPVLMPEVSAAYLEGIAQDAQHLQMLRDLGFRSILSVPLRGRERTLGAISMAASDSRRRFNESDLAIAEDLGRRVATALENARLYQEARDADRHKDEFLAMLAHELRNPLAPIQNVLTLLEQPAADPARKERNWAILRRQVEQLVRLVDDLLDVSRITRGKIQLRMKRVELAGVVAQAVESRRPLIDARRHELIVSLPPSPLFLVADPARLEQVLTNLLNNAAKYTEEGGKIELSVDAEDAQIVVRVRDTGIGIAPELLPRVFDLFQQAERSLDRSQGGLGIGLTLVRRLVELHGGTVEARSAGVGRGSEFVIRLPREQAAPTEPSPGEPNDTP
jgi:PAS domain S-box-containing protein